jgi:thioredoxin reductase (NADPH)
MQAGAERFGAETELAEVLSVELEVSPKVIHTSEGDRLARTVVISTGAGPRELGVPGEAEGIGRGVHYCAACDGMFYRGKTVAVVGGGNSAVADALVLSRIAKKVILIHRRDSLRATKVYHESLEKAENVEFLWNSTVSGFLANGRLTGIKVQNVRNGQEEEIACDGVFVSIGRQPASQLVAGQLALDEAGYIIAGEDTVTSIPGVYAVGDVRTKQVRQVVTAVADGAIASHQVEAYLARYE